MTPKKFTRVLFYVLGTAFALTLLFLITEFTIRNWNEMRNIILALVIGLAIAGLFRLGMWAFSSDPAPRFTKAPDLWVAPDYTVEDAFHLSDGRRCIPRYNAGEFLANFPETPYIDETIGDYRWGKNYEFNPKGEWMWIYKGKNK